MKKILLAIFALTLAVSMSACVFTSNINDEGLDAKNDTENVDGGSAMGGNTMVPNPVKSHADANEVKALLGFTVQPSPEAADVSFSSISEATAQVKFTIENVEHTLRASKTNEDPSGVYFETKESSEIICEFADGNGIVATQEILSNDAYLILWTYGDVHYSLYVDSAYEGFDGSVVSIIISNSAAS